MSTSKLLVSLYLVISPYILSCSECWCISDVTRQSDMCICNCKVIGNIFRRQL